MHIPDGYLGPITCIVMYCVMIPLWIYGGYKIKKEMNYKQVPLFTVGAAFSFILMMFNVPVTFGTTAHAVGGTLIAIVLGPWPALIAVSVALLIQALFFGDGGITTYGANCFNMGFVLPFIGYYLYQLISRNADIRNKIHWVAAGIGVISGLLSQHYVMERN